MEETKQHQRTLTFNEDGSIDPAQLDGDAPGIGSTRSRIQSSRSGRKQAIAMENSGRPSTAALCRLRAGGSARGCRPASRGGQRRQRRPPAQV